MNDTRADAYRRPKVSVYVPVREYGRYLRQCLQSVFAQTLDDWELLIIDDGSRDGSAAIAAEFASRDGSRVRIHSFEAGQGLRACANAALELARGEYIMRLDADDFLDESALLVLANYLDTHPDIGLVYPNWIYVGAEGGIIGVEIRRPLEADGDISDLPAHGACTMVRRRVLKAIGGYDPRFLAQDGHELWIKALHRFRVGNVSTPLFYYRRHEHSMSLAEDRLLQSRREIKRAVASGYAGSVAPRIAVVVPIKNHYPGAPGLALQDFGGRPLVDYTLEQALALPRAVHVLATSDDPEVLEHCGRFGVHLRKREPALSEPMATLEQVVADAVEHLESGLGIFADIVVVLSVHTPLRRVDQIIEAIDTLLVFDVDQVLSTYEDLDLHFRHGARGLMAINAGAVDTVRYEREALFVANGAVQVLWRDLVGRDPLKMRIGHIAMSRLESLQAKKSDDRRILQALLGPGRPVITPPIATERA